MDYNNKELDTPRATPHERLTDVVQDGLVGWMRFGEGGGGGRGKGDGWIGGGAWELARCDTVLLACCLAPTRRGKVRVKRGN